MVHKTGAGHVDHLGLKCFKDACKWGLKRTYVVDDVQLKNAQSAISPGTVAAASDAVVNAQLIGTMSSAANVAGSTVQGVAAALTAATTAGAGQAAGAGNPAGSISAMIQGKLASAAIQRNGAVIWVHVTWERCEWEKCWCKPWKGYNNWIKKDLWHRCSAESKKSPSYGGVGKEGQGISAGFPASDAVGIANAIPGCVKEAMDSAKKIK